MISRETRAVVEGANRVMCRWRIPPRDGYMMLVVKGAELPRDDEVVVTVRSYSEAAEIAAWLGEPFVTTGPPAAA